MNRHARTADPWRDTDVIDSHAARFAQGTTGIVALLGAVFGWPLAWALMAAQLLLGLTLGRRFCVPCVAYFMLVQPRFGEGELEDSRAPRFANAIGFAFLSLAATLWWFGAEPVAAAIGGLVAFLALLSASTGLCAGCELYRLIARIRGISPAHNDRIDPADLPGLGELSDAGAAANGARAYVEFTHPLCSECHQWERRLSGTGERLIKLDVSQRPELARKYGVAIVPTVVAVSADGAVLERLAP